MMLDTIVVVALTLIGILLSAAVIIKLFFRARYRHMKMLLGLGIQEKGEDE